MQYIKSEKEKIPALLEEQETISGLKKVLSLFPSFLSASLSFIRRLKKKFENQDGKSVRLSYIIIPIVLSFVIGFGVLLKLYIDSQQKLNMMEASINSIPTPSEKEIKKLIKQVGEHLILPIGEPKVITLNNIEVLKKEQQFFSNAKNGDILFVYSKKVILFDPIKDKIIDIARIRITPSPTLEKLEPKESSSPAKTQN